MNFFKKLDSVRVERNGGAWCPRQQATHQPRDWLEIDLRQDHVITAVESQGRFGNGQGQEFAEHYLIEYWREPVAKWVRYKDVKGEEVSQRHLPIATFRSRTGLTTRSGRAAHTKVHLYPEDVSF